MRLSLDEHKLGRVGVFTCALLFSCMLAAGLGNAATVRGRLDRLDASGQHKPAPYVAVTLNDPHRGRSSIAYTDLQGMYYLYNVPHGSYYLEIWLSKNPKQKPKAYKIDVQKEPYTDVAAIVIP